MTTTATKTKTEIIQATLEFLKSLPPAEVKLLNEDVEYWYDREEYHPTRDFKKEHGFRHPHWEPAFDEDVYSILVSLMSGQYCEIADEDTDPQEIVDLAEELWKVYLFKMKQGRLDRFAEQLNDLSDEDRKYVLGQVN